MSLKSLTFDRSWSLFLDRDGVINRKIENDYVRNVFQFELIEGVIEALKILREIFGIIVIVTNQRGIGKGLMTEGDLEKIHEFMLEKFAENNVWIDGIYYCPHDPEREECNCRKPKIGLALKAKRDFPNIDFGRSVMVGDSTSDMEFGKTLGMLTVFISSASDINQNHRGLIDLQYRSLFEFAKSLGGSNVEKVKG